MNQLIAIAVSVAVCIGVVGSSRADSAESVTNVERVWITTALEQISSDRMLADIKTLSGPTYRGRQAGSPEDETSATFVANRFRELRLERSPASLPDRMTNPLPMKEWIQTTSTETPTISGTAMLRLTAPKIARALKAGMEFLPILDSPSANLEAPIVFVGYGLSDPSRNVDDYADTDVRSKIVLFLRGKPPQYSGPASHADKERIAKNHGALAYLTATGPILTAYEQRRGVAGTPSAFYSTANPADRLPGAWISTALAEMILDDGMDKSQRLRKLQEQIHHTGSLHSVGTNVMAQMQWNTTVTPGTLYNVLSIIRGRAGNSEQAVVIGAHRDHFGEQAGLLFPGADDNASGTAVLLEVARLLTLAPEAPKRSILFASFSGEERGLLGSHHYVSQPIVPLSKTVAMINVDHAGVGNGRLTVGMTGWEKSLAQEVGRLAGLSDKLDVYGFFPGGDHVPFKEAGVPTITVVSAGVHPHFHQSTDTADTIDADMLRSVAQYVLATAWRLANQP